MPNKKETPTNTDQELSSDSIDTSDGLTVEPKPAKKKKKKNKAGKNKAKTVFYGPSGELLSAPYEPQAEPRTDPNSSPLERATETPEVVLTLPVKPDEWFISPATYDRDGNQLTEETFIYLKEGIDIVTIPFNETNFEGLAKLLTERFAPDESNTEADFFHIRTPFSDTEEANPVMTLTQKNRILATTSLDQKSLKRLIKALQKHVERPPTLTSWLVRWWGKHKIWRVILMIASLPVVLFLLYSVFWGVTHS
jgi:hypothetical protein